MTEWDAGGERTEKASLVLSPGAPGVTLTSFFLFSDTQ